MWLLTKGVGCCSGVGIGFWILYFGVLGLTDFRFPQSFAFSTGFEILWFVWIVGGLVLDCLYLWFWYLGL